MVYPLDPVSQLFHPVYELPFVTAVCNSVVDGVHQPEFFAVPTQGSAVLLLVHGTLFRLFVWLQGFQAKPPAYFIGSVPQLLQLFLVDLDLISGLTVDGVDHEMVVPMIFVDVGGNYHFESLEQLRRFYADLMDLLRCSMAIRFERLHILYEKHTAGLSVGKLGRHKLLIGRLWDTVLTADQLDTVQHRFLVLHDIIQHSLHSGSGLRFLGDRSKYCHITRTS